MSFRTVFRHRPFAMMWTGRLLSTIGIFVQSVAIGWQVYSVARMTRSIEESSFLVGMVGLAQFLPMFLLALWAGEMADRYDRRKILLSCSVLQIFCAASFALVAMGQTPSLPIIFCIAALFGVARAFLVPAGSALGPMLVPPDILPRAVAWNSISIQGGMILGPWIGGALSAISPFVAYVAAGILFTAALTCVFFLRANTKPQTKAGSRLTLIREGLNYVWSTKIVLGAISLDLCAVLLGGVTALLPVYARDILQIGPQGFGILRSGSALGGVAMLYALTHRPIRRYAGVWMLLAVGIYGVATTVFAVSKTLWLSMIMLMILGAADAVSVFVRQSLIQIVTPDRMRGRVSAVSGLFISASNELGEFESGVAARLLGPIGAAIFGGVGSILITAIWAKIFPDLRKADKLEAPKL